MAFARAASRVESFTASDEPSDTRNFSASSSLSSPSAVSTAAAASAVDASHVRSNLTSTSSGMASSTMNE